MIPSQAPVDSAFVYTNFSGLGALKHEAGNNEQEAIPKVAKQFESVMLQMVMKSMREASKPLKSELFQSQDLDLYEDMFDSQLSLTLSQGNGIGLAKMLAQQIQKLNRAVNHMGAENKATPEEAETQSVYAQLNNSGNLSLSARDQQMIKSFSKLNEDQIATTAASVIPSWWRRVSKGIRKLRDFNTPEEFITSLLPAATEVAKRIGVDPRVILAQAALETAWGRSILGSHSGTNSHNLFGIKASNWDGASVTATTHEYYDGKKVKEDDSFRSYSSYADSFADYISFLQKNPRYQHALANAQDPGQFTKALQDAGYATDPYYAQKIMQIFHSMPIQTVVP